MDKVIGWIGVGSMGSRMAMNLSRGGYSIIVADKISTEAAPKNAKVAINNQELAKKAEVVIFSVPAGPDTSNTDPTGYFVHNILSLKVFF